MFQGDKFDYHNAFSIDFHTETIAWQVIKAVKRWSFPLDGPRPGKYMNQARMGQEHSALHGSLAVGQCCHVPGESSEEDTQWHPRLPQQRLVEAVRVFMVELQHEGIMKLPKIRCPG